MATEQDRLENTMMGETVIYMDDAGKRHPAIIVSVASETEVGLAVLDTTTGRPEYRHSVIFSATDAPNRWWRRIRI